MTSVGPTGTGGGRPAPSERLLNRGMVAAGSKQSGERSTVPGFQIVGEPGIEQFKGVAKYDVETRLYSIDVGGKTFKVNVTRAPGSGGEPAAQVGFVMNVVSNTITWRHSEMPRPATIAWKKGPLLDTSPDAVPWWPGAGHAEIRAGETKEIECGDYPGWGVKHYITESALLRTLEVRTGFHLWLAAREGASGPFQYLAEWVYTNVATLKILKDPLKRGEVVAPGADLSATSHQWPEFEFELRTVGTIDEFIPPRRKSKPVLVGPVANHRLNQWVHESIEPQIFAPR